MSKKQITVTVSAEGLDEQVAAQVAAVVTLRFHQLNIHAKLVDKLGGAGIRSLAGDEYALHAELAKTFAAPEKVEDTVLLVVEAK